MTHSDLIAPCASSAITPSPNALAKKQNVQPKYAYPEIFYRDPASQINLTRYDAIKENLQQTQTTTWPDAAQFVDQVQQDLGALQAQLNQVNQKLAHTQNPQAAKNELSLLA